MSPLDLVRGRDGTMDLTKLSATSAHLLMAAAFCRMQVLPAAPEFSETLWMVYGGFAIFHHLANKGAAMFADFKDKKLEAESIAPNTTVTVTNTTETVAAPVTPPVG